MKVGIWGYGFVGQAQHSIIQDTEVTIYDVKYKYKQNRDKMLDQDIIFVCVPTPTEAFGQNPLAVLDALDWLAERHFTGVVAVKSTIFHEYLTDYQGVLNLCYNPEFLNQNTSIKDAAKQSCVILGGDIACAKIVQKFYEDHTVVCAEYEFMTIKEASDFKYTRNLYGAYKVLFWEFIQDTTGNARKMADLYKKMEYQSEMSQVGMDAFRGFGGACFPKDTSAWHMKNGHELTGFMLKYNKTLSEK